MADIQMLVSLLGAFDDKGQTRAGRGDDARSPREQPGRSTARL